MATTVASIITDAQLVYSDLPLATNPTYGSQVLRLLNLVHVDLCEFLPLATTSYDVPLVAGTREYNISETYKAILTADYWYSATNAPTQLIWTSVDELDIEDPGWKNTFTGIPYRWYEYTGATGQPIVGFDPVPSLASSGGYPTVRLLVSLYTALAAGDSLPTSIKSPDCYIDGLVYQWSKYKGKPDWQMRKAAYEESKANLAAYFARKQRHNMAQLSPSLPFGFKSV